MTYKVSSGTLNLCSLTPTSKSRRHYRLQRQTYCSPILTCGLVNAALTENMKSVSHKTVVFVTFVVAVGMKVCSGLYSISARLWHYHFSLIKVNYCSGKSVHISSNVILYSMLCFVLDLFMAVISQYGIFSPLQISGLIKPAIWLLFTEIVYC